MEGNIDDENQSESDGLTEFAEDLENFVDADDASSGDDLSEADPPIEQSDITTPADWIFNSEFTVKGRVDGYINNGRLYKAIKFRPFDESVRQFITTLPIDSEFSLPCYCPFIMYEIVVQMAPSSSYFLVREILVIRKLYAKNGIPREFIMSLIEKDRRGDITFMPKFIKSARDFRKIKGTHELIRSLTQAFKPYFKSKIFYSMLHHFPDSFLFGLTDTQMKELLVVMKKVPYSFCFRETFSDVYEKVVKPKYDPGRKGVKYQTWVLDKEYRGNYALERWKVMVSDERIVNYDKGMPIWNLHGVRMFCKRFGIQQSQEQYSMIKKCIFTYMAFERDRLAKVSTILRSPRITLEMISKLTECGILYGMDDLALYSPRDRLDNMKSLEILYNAAEKLYVIDSNANMDGMYEYLIDLYRKQKDKNSGLVILVPYVSNMLYFIGKIEKGAKFERDRPKRGRKKKTHVKLDEEPLSEFTENEKYPIYFAQQFRVLVNDGTFPIPKNLVIFNAQEYDTKSFNQLFEYRKKHTDKIESLTVIGNTGMWCDGSKTFFNVLCQCCNVMYIVPKSAEYDSRALYSVKTIRKKCDMYENEDLFAESLVEWVKNNGVKWKLKNMLFTNKRLMDKLCMATNSNIFRLGFRSVIYVDALVRVEPIGILGILKKAYQVSRKNVLSETLDIFTGIFPQLHRYILKIEDYYTKTQFTIDTKYQVCTSVSFSMVGECMSIPYEYAIFIADETTTTNDISKAMELTRGTFMIYYRRGIEIEKLFTRIGKWPENLTEYDFKKYGTGLKKFSSKANGDLLTDTLTPPTWV